MTTPEDTGLEEIASRWFEEIQSLEEEADTDHDDDTLSDWITDQLRLAYTSVQTWRGGVLEQREWAGGEVLLADNGERALLTWSDAEPYVTILVTRGARAAVRRVHAPRLIAQLDCLI